MRIAAFVPDFSSLRGDIFGGLTAAVVALPLALAFGVASGLGPVAGLYGAIATGFFASVFGGTRAQVTGPTGPMTVVMGAIIASHTDNLSEAFGIVVLGGLIQILFGVARLGRYVTYTPYSVVSGFMTGIGAIIILLQLPVSVGLPAAEGGPVGAITAVAGTNAAAIGIPALALAILSLAIAVLWPLSLRRYAPPALAALIIGTLASLTLVPGAPVIGDVPSALPTITIPTIGLDNLAAVVQGALVLGLLGSIDSLLTSLVADSITRTRHDSNRELIGQGIGNIVAGLIGGLPGAGATMRTVVNVRSGGRSPVSGALHALVLLALALGLGPLASKIPHAVLAGILLKVGWDIVDWGYVTRLHRVPRDKATVMVITFLLTVFVDLITAVAVGIVLAALVNASWLADEQLKGITLSDGEGGDLSAEERAQLRRGNGHILVTSLRGAFSFASARDLARRILAQTGGYGIVIYDFSATGYVDPSAAMALDDLFDQAEKHGQTVLISGLQGAAERALAGFGILNRIAPENRFPRRDTAIAGALTRLQAAGPAE